MENIADFEQLAYRKLKRTKIQHGNLPNEASAEILAYEVKRLHEFLESANELRADLFTPFEYGPSGTAVSHGRIRYTSIDQLFLINTFTSVISNVIRYAEKLNPIEAGFILYRSGVFEWGYGLSNSAPIRRFMQSYDAALLPYNGFAFIGKFTNEFQYIPINRDVFIMNGSSLTNPPFRLSVAKDPPPRFPKTRQEGTQRIVMGLDFNRSKWLEFFLSNMRLFKSLQKIELIGDITSEEVSALNKINRLLMMR